MRKNFLSQKAESEEEWDVVISGIGDLKVTLWSKIQPYLRREIIVADQQVQWSDQESPSEDELDKFISFYDQTHRRSFKLDVITDTDLNRWTDGRKITINICHYSTAVVNKTIWGKVEKKLLKPAAKDKAGAAAEAAVDQMINELKTAHRFHYVANYITWRMWADYVLKQPGNQWQSAIQAPPPHHMLHLFTAARTNPDDLVSELRHNLSIGKSINSGFEDDVAQLVNEFQQLKVKFDNVFHGMISLESRLNALQAKCKTTGDNLSLFEVAVPPSETEFSAQMFDQIIEQDDIDHTN